MSGLDRRTFVLGCITASLAGCARSVRGWPKGYVSLTYDDGLSSQLDIAVPQLERAGFRGTFFLTWNNMQDRAQDWAALARRGHELANHTISHPCDLQREGVEQFKDKEIDPMQHWLARIEGPKRSRDFAYPCDVTNIGPGNPNQQADRYANLLRSAGVVRARTSEGPPNSLQWTEDAPYRLQALAFGYDAQSGSQIKDYLDHAVRDSRWAILVFHEIGSGKPSDGSISPREHAGLLQMIREMRLPCGTIQSAIEAGRIPLS